MKNSFDLPDNSENTATLSHLSYPPSINLEHQNEKTQGQKQAAGNLAREAEG
jgi:hypothetical protein